ncbi:hypothetical protein OE766_03470 [Pararhizobium sp. YC-54]|uniref:hypothetical protein n=1 Tax=Pararhizobium sp. YC-54 TaxID=2986920 RepID=UPI0021F74B48|nr:hypothetical protein [Pararhizobium sp. YC-54]MCV9997297.1 hypothetical protein [Pararhizobium sp. YC-54]
MTDHKAPEDQLSEATTPKAIVARLNAVGIEISERTLRERARQLGACRIIGKSMFLMPSDIEAILEASKPKPRRPLDQPSSSTDLDNARLALKLAKSRKRNKG